jgi:hypothetical protein
MKTHLQAYTLAGYRYHNLHIPAFAINPSD